MIRSRLGNSATLWLAGVFTFALVLFCIKIMTESMDKYKLPLGVYLGMVAIIVWIFTAGRYWWFAYPCLAFWGGYISLGFKIYPDELGLFVAIAGFLVYAVKNREGIRQNRPSVTWALILLIAYSIVHMSISYFISNLSWPSGGGSIIRVYSPGLSALLFCWLFYKFGSAQDVKKAIQIVFAILALRILLSLLYYYAPNLFNFAEGDVFFLYSSTDLRFSSLYEMILCIAIYYFTNKRTIKNAILLLIISLFAVILLGKGRASVACAALVLVIWILLAKKLRFLVFLSPLFLILIMQVFVQAPLISKLPLEAQRSLSFIPGLKSQLIYDTEGSNQWHAELFSLGYEKWTNTWSSFLVGNAIDARDIYSFYKLNYSQQLEIAASSGRYESTLWTVLATLGVLGFSLYIFIFVFLCRDIVSEVLKEGISSGRHGIYAMALISLTLVILFGWTRGGFPSIEILFCVMAKVIYEEQKITMINGSKNRGIIAL